MKRAGVIEIDRGWKRIQAELASLNGTAVYVGVPAGSSSAKYAAVNEFGSSDGHTPERSFMRSSFDENQRNANRLFDSMVGEVYRGTRTFNSVTHAMGILLRDAAKRKIESGVPPPNHPDTVRRKGHARTLIHTRALLNEIAFYVRTVRSGAMQGVARVRWRLGNMR